MSSAGRWNNRFLSIGASIAVNAAILGALVRVLAAPSKPAETHIAVELESPVPAVMRIQPPKPRTIAAPVMPAPRQQPPTPPRRIEPQPPKENPRSARSIVPKLNLPRVFGDPEPRRNEERRVATPTRPPDIGQGDHSGGMGIGASSTGGGGSGTTGRGPGAPSAYGTGGSGGTIVGGDGGSKSVVAVPPPVKREPEPKRVEQPQPKPAPPAPRGESRGAQAKSQPQPVYPSDAREDGVEGTVLLIADIGTDGKVVGTRLDKSSGDRRLDRAAEKAVKQWTYSPALKDGVPVKSSIRVRVEFRLD